jgi:hypothetical protein
VGAAGGGARWGGGLLCQRDSLVREGRSGQRESAEQEGEEAKGGVMGESKPNYSQARCDLHPEHPLAWLSSVQLRDDDGSPSNSYGGQCKVPGCDRYFSEENGYRSVYLDPEVASPRCSAHGDLRPFMVVLPTADGFAYVCTVEGCPEMQSWTPTPRGK